MFSFEILLRSCIHSETITPWAFMDTQMLRSSLEKVKFQYCPFLANIKTSSTLLKLPRFSKYYEIQKRPQNIISLRMQTSYGLTLLADVLLFDQIKIFILLAYKSYFGSESTFGIWLFGLVLDILGKKQRRNT